VTIVIYNDVIMVRKENLQQHHLIQLSPTHPFTYSSFDLPSPTPALTFLE